MSLESICHFRSMYWTIMLTMKKEWMEGRFVTAKSGLNK